MSEPKNFSFRIGEGGGDHRTADEKMLREELKQYRADHKQPWYLRVQSYGKEK